MNPQLRTYRCPNCSEMVNERMTTCKYCQVALDPAVGLMLAERQDKANQAYSDASYLRNAAVGMFVFLAVSRVFGLAYFGFIATFVVSLVLFIRWQVKFSNLLTNDTDYASAKRSRNFSLLLILLAIPAGIIFGPLLDVIVAFIEELSAA
jgi:hypothetical protein